MRWGVVVESGLMQRANPKVPVDVCDIMDKIEKSSQVDNV